MNQQDGRVHINTIPAINITIIWSRQKAVDNRKEDTPHQYRKDELILGAGASTGRSGS